MSQLPGLRKRDRQLRLIVEHLLEMRDVPIFIHGVTVKAPAQVVAHASRGHLAQGEKRHGFGAVCVVTPGARREAQKKIDYGGPGKFRGAAEPSMFFVKTAGKTLESAQERCLIRNRTAHSRRPGLPRRAPP